MAPFACPTKSSVSLAGSLKSKANKEAASGRESKQRVALAGIAHTHARTHAYHAMDVAGDSTYWSLKVDKGRCGWGFFTTAVPKARATAKGERHSTGMATDKHRHRHTRQTQTQTQTDTQTGTQTHANLEIDPEHRARHDIDNGNGAR